MKICRIYRFAYVACSRSFDFIDVFFARLTFPKFYVDGNGRYIIYSEFINSPSYISIKLYFLFHPSYPTRFIINVAKLQKYGIEKIHKYTAICPLVNIISYRNMGTKTSEFLHKSQPFKSNLSKSKGKCLRIKSQNLF